MTSSPDLFRHLVQFPCILLTLLGNVVRFLRLCLRSPASLAAENLFLRKQLALYQERHVTPRCATYTTHLALLWLGRWFELQVLKSPQQSPQANALCERLLGTLWLLDRLPPLHLLNHDTV